jgi:hypothetical protein
VDTVPGEWATFRDEKIGITFRYPEKWFIDESNARVQSWDPEDWTSNSYPKDGVLVEAGVMSLTGTTPGPDHGAVAAEMGGASGWRIVRQYDPPTPSGITWSHAIFVRHGDLTYKLAAFFAQAEPDDTVFLQIASTFEFLK